MRKLFEGNVFLLAQNFFVLFFLVRFILAKIHSIPKGLRVPVCVCVCVFRAKGRTLRESFINEVKSSF